jgi:hypothetical protein
LEAHRDARQARRAVVPLKNDFSGIFEFLKFGRISAFDAVKSFVAEPDVRPSLTKKENM